jgi:hypothetical protein
MLYPNWMALLPAKIAALRLHRGGFGEIRELRRYQYHLAESPIVNSTFRTELFDPGIDAFGYGLQDPEKIGYSA